MTEHTTNFQPDEDVSANNGVYQLSELFYSRTDHRGVIQAGNTIFQRVSSYDWDELLGAPHKLVRHPDMPKGIFYLMWERLKAGLPTGVYIKNKQKSGRHYWVFSVVIPSQDSYFSTRMMPTSPMFKKVTAMYADILARENNGELTPQQSGAAILETLKHMGFANYDAFQSEAVASEFMERDQKLGRKTGLLQKRFLDMSQALKDVHSETFEMTDAFKAIRTVPLNMRLIASRLENAGGPIGAISVNYSQMLEEMSTWVSTFVDGEACVFARIRDAILKGQFVGFAVAIEQEMVEVFKTRRGEYPDSVDTTEEVSRFVEHQAEIHQMVSESLFLVEAEAKRFSRSVLDMKRYVTGLSSTRMMCKIESAALSNSGTALAGIVEQLDACQNEIEERLARIVELNSIIQGNTMMLRALL